VPQAAVGAIAMPTPPRAACGGCLGLHGRVWDGMSMGIVPISSTVLPSSGRVGVPHSCATGSLCQWWDSACVTGLGGGADHYHETSGLALVPTKVQGPHQDPSSAHGHAGYANVLRCQWAGIIHGPYRQGVKMVSLPDLSLAFVNVHPRG
jgi:hypothetical protein